ncbi:MAG: hypothetical protein L0Y56_21030 [Nitrospira sp.]|nr:hypothetical protein [Nitrospira sp.]
MSSDENGVGVNHPHWVMEDTGIAIAVVQAYLYSNMLAFHPKAEWVSENNSKQT